jgi:hypothetical protein
VKLAERYLHHGAVERYKAFPEKRRKRPSHRAAQGGGSGLNEEESILASQDVFEQYVNSWTSC